MALAVLKLHSVLGILFAGDHCVPALFHSKGSGLSLKCFSTLSSFQCICLLFCIDILSKLSREFAYAYVRTSEEKEHNLVLIKPVTVHSHSLVSSMKRKYLLPYIPVLRVRITRFHLSNSC